jgi:hypothetical protein
MFGRAIRALAAASLLAAISIPVHAQGAPTGLDVPVGDPSRADQ